VTLQPWSCYAPGMEFKAVITALYKKEEVLPSYPGDPIVSPGGIYITFASDNCPALVEWFSETFAERAIFFYPGTDLIEANPYSGLNGARHTFIVQNKSDVALVRLAFDAY